MISERPHARMFEGLLTEQECAYLITAAGEFEPSMVYDPAGQLVRDTIRTSDGATFHWDIEDPAIHAINRRLAAASRTDYDAGEALQVLRYAPGQQYRPHFDWVGSAANQRLWTALIYLNEAYEGGATAFVRTDIEVRGRTGDVLLFSNARPDGMATSWPSMPACLSSAAPNIWRPAGSASAAGSLSGHNVGKRQGRRLRYEIRHPELGLWSIFVKPADVPTMDAKQAQHDELPGAVWQAELGLRR